MLDYEHSFAAVKARLQTCCSGQLVPPHRTSFGVSQPDRETSRFQTEGSADQLIWFLGVLTSSSSLQCLLFGRQLLYYVPGPTVLLSVGSLRIPPLRLKRQRKSVVSITFRDWIGGNAKRVSNVIRNLANLRRNNNNNYNNK